MSRPSPASLHTTLLTHTATAAHDIPTLSALKSSPAASKTLVGPLHLLIREATLDDLPNLGPLTYDGMRLDPFHLAVHCKVSRDDMVDFWTSRMREAVLDPANWVYVATDLAGKLHGMLAFSKYTGVEVGRGFAAVPNPPGTDMEAVRVYQEVFGERKQDLLRMRGAHYWGETLSVDPTSRLAGTGTYLAKVLATRALEERLPVFFRTTYFSMPFYDRFTSKNGYKVEIHRPDIKVPNMVRQPVFIYIVEILKGDEPRVEEKRRGSTDYGRWR